MVFLHNDEACIIMGVFIVFHIFTRKKRGNAYRVSGSNFIQKAIVAIQILLLNMKSHVTLCATAIQIESGQHF
jgi:hypothetical protein